MATQETNLDSLKKDIDSLKADFKEIMKSIKSIGAERAESAKDKILDQLNSNEIKKYIEMI